MQELTVKNIFEIRDYLIQNGVDGLITEMAASKKYTDYTIVCLEGQENFSSENLKNYIEKLTGIRPKYVTEIDKDKKAIIHFENI